MGDVGDEEIDSGLDDSTSHHDLAPKVLLGMVLCA